MLNQQIVLNTVKYIIRMDLVSVLGTSVRFAHALFVCANTRTSAHLNADCLSVSCPPAFGYQVNSEFVLSEAANAPRGRHIIRQRYRSTQTPSPSSCSSQTPQEMNRLTIQTHQTAANARPHQSRTFYVKAEGSGVSSSRH